MENDEIDHVAQPRAISKIADDACQQQRAGSQHTVIVSRRPQKIEEYRQRRSDREHYENPPSERAAFLQLPKRDATILGVNEIEEAGDYRSLVAKPECAHRPGLGRLIDHVDTEACEYITHAPTETRTRDGCRTWIVEFSIHFNQGNV